MHVERLRKLEQLLRDDAKNEKGVKFNLAVWASPSQTTPGLGGYAREKWVDKVEPSVSCGTTACALGLAAISGVFKDEGLDYRVYEAGSEVDENGVKRQLFILEPDHGGHSGFEAGQSFFDLTYSQSHFLFDPAAYDDIPKGAAGEIIVADRIAGLINGDYDTDDYDPDGDDEFSED